MAILNYYRIYCNTEATYIYNWSETTPTVCPNNSGHSIDTSKTAIINKVGSPSPTWFDNKEKVIPVIFPEGTYLYICGYGDHSTNGRGEGTEFIASSESVGDTNVEFQFNDYVYLAGGGIYSGAAELGDWMRFKIYAPATTVEVNGTTTGNCNLYAIGGGINMIIPVNNSSGTHDYSAQIPVSNSALTGYFDWDMPDTGSGTVSPNYTQTGYYDCFDTALDLVTFIQKRPIVGTGFESCTIPAVEPKIMLPQWKGKVTMHNGGHTGLEAAWYLACGRKATT